MNKYFKFDNRLAEFNVLCIREKQTLFRMILNIKNK